MIKDIIPNNMELTEMLGMFSQEMNQRFDKLSSDMNQRFDKVDERLNYHQTWLERIEGNMATKGQLNSLAIILKDKEVINSFEVAHIKQTDSV
jgi:hypothetical protein